MPLRLAVATEDFGTSVRDAIRDAARCRVDGLRLNARTEVPAAEFSDTALRQLKHYAGECGMKIAGLMFGSRRPLQEPQHLERRLENLRRTMTMVRKLGTSELLVRCGRIPNPDAEPDVEDQQPIDPAIPTNTNVDSLRNPFSYAPEVSSAGGLAGLGNPSEQRQFATLCEILNDLVRYGNHVGCVLQIQPATYHSDRILRLLSEVRSGPVGIVFDPATAVMTGGSPVRLFRDLYRQVGYVRARDAVSDVDGAGVEVAFGEGRVDWEELLPTISEAEYSGWVCIERSGGEQRAEDAREGVARICKLLPGRAH